MDRDEAELRALARLHVRAGLLDGAELREVMVEAVRVQMPRTDPEMMARAWVLSAIKELREESAAWQRPTDHDRVESALAECVQHSIMVLRQVSDLGEVRDAVQGSTVPLRAVLWFDEQAVWNAIEDGVLELGMRHGNGAPLTVDDPVAAQVVACFARHGLDARQLQDRLQVRTRWQRVPR